MHRLIVAFLTAFDAAIAVAVGIAATLAPLTLVWVLGLGDTADWGALWPASAAVWQLGHLVPLQITLPGDYLAVTGIDPSAASFTLSLAPLAFTAFTAIFAARSGARAAHADAWITGVLTGTGVVAVLATVVALAAQNRVASAQLWQAVLFPTLIFGVPALLGAVVTEWREAPAGVVARVRDRVEALPSGWGSVVGVGARASAVAVVGLVGAGALVLTVAFALRAGEIVALYQAGNLDLLGAIVVTLAQFAYVPTLVVWGLSFVAGPGFALGEGTAVSPSGTQLSVVPGVPILGAIPESTSSWLLLVVLVPVGIGALAGWVARSHLLAAAGLSPMGGRGRTKPSRETAEPTDAAADANASTAPLEPLDEARRATLEGLLASAEPRTPSTEEDSPAPLTSDAGIDSSAESTGERTSREREVRPIEPLAPRLVVMLVIAALSAGASAILSIFASGSAGPGQFAHVGPEPGPVALAVGLETLVGAGILLLASRRRGGDRSSEASSPDSEVVLTPSDAAAGADAAAPAPVAVAGAALSGAPEATTTARPAAWRRLWPIRDSRGRASHPAPANLEASDEPAPASPGQAAPLTADPQADTAPIDLPAHPDGFGGRPPLD